LASFKVEIKNWKQEKKEQFYLSIPLVQIDAENISLIQKPKPAEHHVSEVTNIKLK